MQIYPKLYGNLKLEPLPKQINLCLYVWYKTTAILDRIGLANRIIPTGHFTGWSQLAIRSDVFRRAIVELSFSTQTVRPLWNA